MAKKSKKSDDGKKRSGAKGASHSSGKTPVVAPHQLQGEGLGRSKAGGNKAGTTAPTPTVQGAVRRRVASTYARGKK